MQVATQVPHIPLWHSLTMATPCSSAASRTVWSHRTGIVLCVPSE
ncbi:Uncharacterised protein [Mycobacterium tuberculosis]|nr:Uncharacterised protein [Mycobacterium tuberculosis]